MLPKCNLFKKVIKLRTPLGLLNFSKRLLISVLSVLPEHSLGKELLSFEMYDAELTLNFTSLHSQTRDHQQADTNCFLKMFWKIVTLMPR